MERVYIKSGLVKVKEEFEAYVKKELFDPYLMIRLEEKKRVVETPIRLSDYVHQEGEGIEVVWKKHELFVKYIFLDDSKDSLKRKIKSFKTEIKDSYKLLKEELEYLKSF